MVGKSGGSAEARAREKRSDEAQRRSDGARGPRTKDEIGRHRVTELRRRVRERAYDDPAIGTEVARRMIERGDL
jgi:hypothetical protein